MSKFACLLKKFIIALHVVLFILYLVTKVIKSAYAEFGYSVLASKSDSSKTFSSFSKMFSLITELSEIKILGSLGSLKSDMFCSLKIDDSSSEES
jgi:hypothetical protein